MQQQLPLPLPAPPAEAVAQVLDELRDARRELADARRLLALLALDTIDPTPHDRLRLTIERAAAERRRELWASAAELIEQRARALGLDVSAQL